MERRKNSLRFKQPRLFPSLKKIPSNPHTLFVGNSLYHDQPMTTRHIQKPVPKLSLRSLAQNSPPASGKVFMSNRSIRNTSLHSKQPGHRHSNSMPEINEIRFPVTAGYVLQNLADSLSGYEIKEIQEFKKIYYLGRLNKKHDTNSKSRNFGFDDSKAEYRVLIGDHIQYRY